MIASPKRQQMTASEYLSWESQQALRYEYCNGEVLAMAGGTKNHAKIAFNFQNALSPRINEKKLRHDCFRCESNGYAGTVLSIP